MRAAVSMIETGISTWGSADEDQNIIDVLLSKKMYKHALHYFNKVCAGKQRVGATAVNDPITVDEIEVHE